VGRAGNWWRRVRRRSDAAEHLRAHDEAPQTVVPKSFENKLALVAELAEQISDQVRSMVFPFTDQVDPLRLYGTMVSGDDLTAAKRAARAWSPTISPTRATTP
jgi:hypothetical protein